MPLPTINGNVLILRNGSLGDTVAALPALRLIADLWPGVRKTVLSALPSGSRAVALESVLNGTGYVDEIRTYDGAAPLVAKFRQVREHIKTCRPAMTVYLLEPRGRLATLRDASFLHFSGAGPVCGLPWGRDLQGYRRLPDDAGFEHETDRLLRVLSQALGVTSPVNQADWLRLTPEEHLAADHLLAEWPGQPSFMALSIGCRVPLKDWGENNWVKLLGELEPLVPTLGLAIFGTAEDREQAERVRRHWTGPSLNLCGLAPPRVSAAVMQRAQFFLGNDGGSMHLAAAVGIKCVAIFTARSPKGVWFPYGDGHCVFYRDLPCSGCLLNECPKYDRRCITSITVDEVLQGVIKVLREQGRINAVS